MATAAERLTAAENRIDQIEARIDQIEARGAAIAVKVDQVRNAIARFRGDIEVGDLEARIERIAEELESVISDAQNTRSRLGDMS